MIKALLGFAAATLLFSLQMFAQPRLYIEGGGKSLDFGDVYTGTKLTHDVKVKNVGKDTLHITNVKAQCGCTATLLKQNTIAPGDSSVVTVTFNSASYPPGKVIKHVYFASNDTTTGGSQTLEFTAVVTAALMLDPGFFSFNPTKLDSIYSKSIKITNTSKVPVNIESITTKADFLSLSIGKKHLAPGESTELQGVLHPTKPGTYQGIVEMTTDHPDQKKLEIRYLAWINRK